MGRPYCLTFLDKFFPATGAGDGDLSLTPGNPDGLAALGAFKIPVIPVPDAVHEFQKSPVLLVPLVGIPGEAAENGPEHQNIGYTMENQIDQRVPDEQGQDDHHQGSAQNRAVEFVVAVAALHKAAEGQAELCAGLAEEIPESVHNITLVRNILLLTLYCKITGFQLVLSMLTDCLRFP